MEKRTRTQKTIINTIAGLINSLCKTFLNFFLRTVFIYTLGIQYTGVSSVFTDILTMLSLSELGIGTAIATALYVPLREKDEVQIQKLMKFYRHAYQIIAVFIMLVGIILLPFLDYLITDVPDIHEDIRIIFIFYIIKTAASYLLVYKTTILNADQKQYIVKGKETVCNFFRYATEMICLLIFKQFMLYLIIEVVATVVQNYVITQRAVKEYPYAFQKCTERLSKDHITKLFRDIKGLSMYQISATIGNSIDNILISGFISTTIAGVLSNYTMIRKQLEILVKQFFGAVTPSVGNLVAERNREKQIVVFNRIFYFSFLSVNFCATSMFVLFGPFIKLWLGDRYLLSEKIAFIISFDFFLYILLQAIASFRTANGLFVKGQYRPLITAVVNVFLSVMLIKRLGILGTILATSISRILTQWYDPYILYKEIFKISFKGFYLKYWCYIILFWGSCLLTISITNLVIIENVWLAFVCKGILCIFIPNIFAVLFTFRTKEFAYCINIVKEKIKK